MTRAIEQCYKQHQQQQHIHLTITPSSSYILILISYHVLDDRLKLFTSIPTVYCSVSSNKKVSTL